MKRKITTVLLCLGMMLSLCACAQSASIAEMRDDVNNILAKIEPVPTVTPSAEPKVKPAATARPSATPKPSPTPMVLELPEDAEESQLPSESPEPSASPSPTPTPTPAPTPEPTPQPTPTPTPKPTPTPEPVFTPYPESMAAPMPESVPYATPQPTPEPTPEPTEAPEETVETPVEAQPEPTPAPTPVPSNASGQAIADFACQYVGYNYLYGAESPEEGFDCSGLVYYVYQQFGYTLNRTAAAQAYNGEHVELDAIEPGDILCFYNQGSYIGHCGIYIGDGNYVHAQDSATGVVISPLSERTCRIEARRML